MVFVGVVDNLREPILNQRRDREANESEKNPELEHYNIIIIIFWRMYFFIPPNDMPVLWIKSASSS